MKKNNGDSGILSSWEDLGLSCLAVFSKKMPAGIPAWPPFHGDLGAARVFFLLPSPCRRRGDQPTSAKIRSFLPSGAHLAPKKNRLNTTKHDCCRPDASITNGKKKGHFPKISMKKFRFLNETGTFPNGCGGRI